MELKNTRDVLVCLLLAVMIGCTVGTYLMVANLIRTTTETIAAVPQEISQARYDINEFSTHARDQLLAEMEYEIEPVQKELVSTLRALPKKLDDTNASVQQIATATSWTFASLKPTLQALPPAIDKASASIDALVNDSDKAVKELTPQALGLVAASKVTAGETAQTMREIKNAAPAMVASIEHIAASADGIAADAKTEADIMTKPKPWWQKILGPIYTAARIIAIFF